jgi:hypothetical protein
MSVFFSWSCDRRSYDPLSGHYSQYLTNLRSRCIDIPSSNTKSCSELDLNADFLSYSDLHDITAVLCVFCFCIQDFMMRKSDAERLFK